MSQFVGFLEPPGDAIRGYDSKQVHSAQPSSHIPHTFTEAMSVREDVFVTEQKVPLENEFDLDDARSYHWVAYASVGAPSTASAPTTTTSDHTASTQEQEQQQQQRKGSTANKLAVGTIRLVPPPHPPHPQPGSSHAIDNTDGGAPTAATHDGTEPYVKLGRLAVLQPFRGLGLAHLLVHAALTWAAQNAAAVLPGESPTAAEQRKLDHGGRAVDDGSWRGLVLVHAQRHLERMWGRYGFVRDPALGVWDEEGIEHVGMWKRIAVEAAGNGRRKSSV